MLGCLRHFVAMVQPATLRTLSPEESQMEGDHGFGVTNNVVDQTVRFFMRLSIANNLGDRVNGGLARRELSCCNMRDERSSEPPSQLAS